MDEEDDEVGDAWPAEDDWKPSERRRSATRKETSPVARGFREVGVAELSWGSTRVDSWLRGAISFQDKGKFPNFSARDSSFRGFFCGLGVCLQQCGASLPGAQNPSSNQKNTSFGFDI